MYRSKQQQLALVMSLIAVVLVTATTIIITDTTLTITAVQAQLSGATGQFQQQQMAAPPRPPPIVTNATNVTTSGAANNLTTTNSNSSTIATTQSEILWEAEVRERRERAGLPLENNSTLPNLIKSSESLEIDRLQAQDPKFANFETILDQC
jgi:hypothetical protein